MIDYDGFVEHSKPLIIGRYGTQENPPQFINPCSVAIDDDDAIYIADSKNSRVQILSLNGNPLRKPIDLGKNFQPSSVTVNSNRHVFVTDSCLVRVYSFNGRFIFSLA